MPYQSNGRGTFELDREFPGLGRIRRASGTTDGPTFRAINAMLTSLYDRGSHQTLEAIRDGQVKAVHVLSRYRSDSLDRLPVGVALTPLAKSFGVYVTQVPGIEHQRSMKTTIKALALTDNDILNDLPRRLATFAAHGPPRMVELARAHAQAFLRDTIGNDHALYRAVRAVRLPRGRSKARKGLALPITELQKLLQRLPDPARAMARTMAVTGMGTTEYWKNGFTVLADRILIHGQKRRGRERFVPKWAPVVAPTLTARQLRDHLGAVTIYSLRKTFAHVMEEAGIPRTRRRLYMGHGSGDVTGGYELVDVAHFVAADGKAMRHAAPFATKASTVERKYKKSRPTRR